MDLVGRLSYLFGTEEAVKRRRVLVLLREEILNSSYNELVVICSGSLGEGVDYPSSDDDLMYVVTRQSRYLYDNYKTAVIDRALHMIPSEYSTGFCLIQDTRVIDTGVFVIPSKAFREKFAQNLSDCSLHGPCASQTLGALEYDYALCLLSPRWPVMAREWITRTRRWPPKELLESIVKRGCHAVPIGNPDSPLCDLEWRVSFSLADRSLIHAFNHVQFIVYNLLKLILKRVINIRVPDVLCSYFIKTVLFYTIENTSPSFWVNDRIDECYRKCLLLLYHFIDVKNCPNFFIPDNNMMRRKVNSDNRIPLLDVVRELQTRGIVGSLYLYDKDFFALFPFISHAHCELRNDIDFLNGYLLKVTMGNYKILIQEQCGNNVSCTNARRALSPLLKYYQDAHIISESSFLNFIFKQIFTEMGLQCSEISTGVRNKNASRYRILKCGQAMLKIGRNSDISSGKLQLANFMFITGRFRHCLTIIQAVLSNFAPYILSLQIRKSAWKLHKEVICDKAYLLDYKVKKAWAFYVEFLPERFTITPFPAQILLSLTMKTTRKNVFMLHPLVFAYFLQGLCFYKTQDFDSMNISVSLLEDSVRNLPRYAVRDIFKGRLVLGYIRMLQQDYHSSCRNLTSAYTMKSAMDVLFNWDHSDEVHTCVILLACLLNRKFCRR